jgi:hypothetical protein
MFHGFPHTSQPYGGTVPRMGHGLFIIDLPSDPIHSVVKEPTKTSNENYRVIQKEFAILSKYIVKLL